MLVNTVISWGIINSETMKEQKYIITLFATSTKGGRELTNHVLALEKVNQLSVENSMLPCKVNVYYPSDAEYNTIFFMAQQKTSDLVIFDGSIEETENGQLGDNYKCVPHAPYMEANVIIVSRTVLPLNFIPHTTNVLPFGENFKVNDEGRLLPIISYGNESIFKFIQEQIKINLHNKEIETPNQRDAIDSVKKDPLLFLSNGEKMAFISYRSYYNAPNKCGNYSVQDLKEYIIDYHKAKNPNEKWKVIFYPPGGLSQDCPTEYLRWALFTYVDNVFNYVDEVWIFDTNSSDEKSYWDSWFTQGEFLSLMHTHQELPDSMPIVRLFDPHTGNSQILKEWPIMSQQESRRLSLLAANSDILWGNYAAFRNVALFLREWKSYGFMRKAFWKTAVKAMSLVTRLFAPDVELGNFEAMSKEHAYQLEFLTNRIFACHKCAKTGYSMNSFNDNEFIHRYLSIGDSESIKEGFFTLDKDDFSKAVEKGYVECPICHNRTYIKRNPSQDFYLWKKWTKRTNPENDWYIEKIPAYSVINE